MYYLTFWNSMLCSVYFSWLSLLLVCLDFFSNVKSFNIHSIFFLSLFSFIFEASCLTGSKATSWICDHFVFHLIKLEEGHKSNGQCHQQLVEVINSQNLHDLCTYNNIILCCHPVNQLPETPTDHIRDKHLTWIEI